MFVFLIAIAIPLVALVAPRPAAATNNSVGANGVRATGLGLNGNGVNIGQVEISRPGNPNGGFDNALNSHPNVVPANVLDIFTPAIANTRTGDHAQEVAGVMISGNGMFPGVAPGAALSSAGTSGDPITAFQVRAALAAQSVVDIGNMRAINMSFGTAPSGNIDGSDFLSQFLDWSSRQNDLLNIVAGDETGVVLTVPSDHYNGLTVAMTRQAPGVGGAYVGGAFAQVDGGNVFTSASNGRRLVDIVAPGKFIATTNRGGVFTQDTFTDTNGSGGWTPVGVNNNGTAGFQTNTDNWVEFGPAASGYNAALDLYFDRNHNGVRNGAANDDFFIGNGNVNFAPANWSEPIQDVNGNGIVDFRITGTSFAAPHVTAATALLQQFTAAKAAAGAPGFGPNSRRHEVMKAAMMNSADKILDNGAYVDQNANVVPAGFLLGMQRTITRTNNNDWVQQQAAEANRDAIPLDLQLGTGQLNVARAIKQLNAGEQGPGNVTQIGWDYNNTGGFANNIVYAIGGALPANSFVSITLAWDRQISINDTNGAGNHFDAESFIDVDGSGAFNGGDTLNDLNGNNAYDANTNDAFANAVGGPIADLDLYLMPHGNTNLLQFAARSVSGGLNGPDYTVEHIFFQIQTAGLYDILVRHAAGNVANQAYAVAWWTVPEPSSVLIAILGVAALLAWQRRRNER